MPRTPRRPSPGLGALCECSSIAPKVWLGSQPLQPFKGLLRAHYANENIFQGFRSGAQFIERAFGHDLTLVNDGHAIAEPFHHFKDVRREEYVRAAPHLIEQ